jgi:hypothetical protein
MTRGWVGTERVLYEQVSFSYSDQGPHHFRQGIRYSCDGGLIWKCKELLQAM